MDSLVSNVLWIGMVLDSWGRLLVWMSMELGMLFGVGYSCSVIDRFQSNLPVTIFPSLRLH